MAAQEDTTPRIETQAAQERSTEEVVHHNDVDAGGPDPAPKPDSLERREAIRAAVADQRAKREGEAPRVAAQPTQAAVKEAVSDPDLEPPAEFSAEAKEAWRNKDYARVNKEYRRLHERRTAEITRAQNSERAARDEAKTWRDLGDMAKPYIEARGAEGVTPQAAMMEALALIQEFKKADPATVKAELLKIGINLDAATPDGKKHVEQNTALHKDVSDIKQFIEHQQHQQIAAVFGQSINALAALKTRTGDPVYPGFFDGSETGQQFARELGSLTREPVFINLVRRRFPNATHQDFVREAYIQLGGKVAGEAVKVSASNQQQHKEQARRAAASTPGRPTTSKSANGLVGKLSRREAIRAAIAEHGGEN